jgi:heat shock protein HslJ
LKKYILLVTSVFVILIVITTIFFSKIKFNQIPVEDIAGKEFVLTNKFKAADITIAFDAGRYYGFSGVNRYTGSYEQNKKGNIKLSQAATTMMSGNEELMEIEKEYINELAEVEEIILEKDIILMKTKNGQLKYEVKG